jgi:hypothetical protein
MTPSLAEYWHIGATAIRLVTANWHELERTEQVGGH